MLRDADTRVRGIDMQAISRRRLLQSIGGVAGLSLTASLLAACSAGPPAAPAATTAPPAAQPTSAPAAAKPTSAPAATTAPAAAATTAPATTSGGPVTLDLWMLHPEWKAAMAKVVTAVQTAHPGITLNVAPQQSATYQDQVQTALNAG